MQVLHFFGMKEHFTGLQPQGKNRQVKRKASSAIINAHKNTPLGMCSKYCSGEIISDKFFQ